MTEIYVETSKGFVKKYADERECDEVSIVIKKDGTLRRLTYIRLDDGDWYKDGDPEKTGLSFANVIGRDESQAASDYLVYLSRYDRKEFLSRMSAYDAARGYSLNTLVK